MSVDGKVDVAGDIIATPVSSLLLFWDTTRMATENEEIVQDNVAAAAGVAGAAAIEAGNTSLYKFVWGPVVSLNYTLPAMILVAIALFIVIVATAFGNLLVGIALFRYRYLRTISNFLIGNLALSDFLLATTVLPLSIFNECLGHWIFGEIVCNMWLTMDVLYCTASLWNLCVIGFDRFTATVYPLWYRENRSPKQAALYVGLVWFIAAAICVPPVLGWNDAEPNYVPDNATGLYNCNLFEKPSYVLYSACGSFYIPLLITSFFYVRIFAALRERMRTSRLKASKAAATSSSLPSSATTASTSMTSSSVQKATLLDTRRQDVEMTGIKREDESSRRRLFSSDSDLEEDDEQSEDALTTYTSRTAGASCTTGFSEGAMSCSGIVNNSASGSTRLDEQKQSGLQGNVGTATADNSAASLKNASGIEPSDSDAIGKIESTELRLNTEQKNCCKPIESATHDKSDESKQLCANIEKTDVDLNYHQLQSGPVATHKNNVTINSTNNVQHCSAAERIAQSGNTTRHTKAAPPGKSTNSFTSVSSSWKKESKPAENDLASQKASISSKQRRYEQRELRATMRMGIIIAFFCGMWMGFFTVYVLKSWCPVRCPVPRKLDAFFFWLGYANSSINPILYTIFNDEFRRAFVKILSRNKKAMSARGRRR